MAPLSARAGFPNLNFPHSLRAAELTGKLGFHSSRWKAEPQGKAAPLLKS
jgi:hypothetical protein